jgi:hypothetical protein
MALMRGTAEPPEQIKELIEKATSILPGGDDSKD